MVGPEESFGGTAGQVVRGFVRTGTLLTTIPVIVATVFLALVSAAMVDMLALHATASFLVMLVAVSPVTGRFALAARVGDLDAGFVDGHFDGGELASFVLRYGALTVAWGVPTALLASWLLPSLTTSADAGAGMDAMLAGPSALGLVLLLLVAMLAPTLATLVATRTDTVAEALSLDAWRWIAIARRHDLVVFYSSLIGGLILFVLIAAPLLLVLATLALAIAPTLAGVLGVFAWVAPSAASPVLLGRLAGAFVLAEVSSRGSAPTRIHQVLGDGDLPATTIAALGDGAPAGRRSPTHAASGGVLNLTRDRSTDP